MKHTVSAWTSWQRKQTDKATLTLEKDLARFLGVSYIKRKFKQGSEHSSEDLCLPATKRSTASNAPSTLLSSSGAALCWLLHCSILAPPAPSLLDSQTDTPSDATMGSRAWERSISPTACNPQRFLAETSLTILQRRQFQTTALSQAKAQLFRIFTSICVGAIFRLSQQ